MNIGEMKFLVVQNHPFQRHWLSILLSKLGARDIIDAPDSTTALVQFQDHAQPDSEPIHIGCIDMDMSGMDAMALIRHMADSEIRSALVIAGKIDPALAFSVQTLALAHGITLLGFVQELAAEETLALLIKRYAQHIKLPARANADVPVFGIDDVLQALESNQITPYFQPKVELASGQVRGVEAFARWRHPVYGVLSPRHFVPVLEQHQLLGQLTRRMIDKSVAACRRWHDAGDLISVSINLDESMLASADSADRIAAQVAAHRLEARFVIFEITESAIRDETLTRLENMVRLRMKGFELSVDDYGTGNASMQQLLRIPFTELKVDRSFVAGAAENKALSLVLSSSLALAGKLERVSVAVGIETKQDWEFLKKTGCTYGQGFYISKPMEEAALPGWMREWEHFF